MKRTNVSGLKARLSAYLAEVRGGETVLVCDRNHPIAQIVPFGTERNDLVIDPPTQPRSVLKHLPAPRLRRKVDVVALLREDRNQR